MAFGNATFTDAAGAVSDLLGGSEKAAGLRISASGQRISAQGFDLSALGNEQRAQGDEAEATQYGLASTLATQNEAFTEQSVAIQQFQQQRQLTQSLGTTRADVAGSGGTLGGSALDILRDSASQGALTKAVMGQQGLITEAGYKEEAQSYDVMQSAATTAAGFERQEGAIETSMGVQEQGIADQTDALADKTQTDSYITGGIKAAAAVATLFV